MAEASTATDQAGKTRMISLRAKKAAVFVRVSSELAADAPNFDSQLSTAMSAAIAAGVDAACVSGDGAGQPLGMLNSGAMISVAKVSTVPVQQRASARLRCRRRRPMTKRQDRDAIYVKRQFDTEIIVVCVRWYITYRLSYRDLVAMMAERGAIMSHTTIMR